eukprot:TRINITY_DN379_c0_g1_i2.p1 TRINITY_DN379_c0_g1~~TRINITY_DN379_c0_g1_i2.p1  ORF type:complete len:692 (+),score=142.29 TRINITY_DN379_c0_g1_i2:51-2126(+)
MCRVYLLTLASLLVGSACGHEKPVPYSPPQDRFHYPADDQYVEEEHNSEGRPFYNNIEDYIPDDEYQVRGQHDYWYQDENKVVRPSVSQKAGYIPREIMHFRETFKQLRSRYPDRPLLSPEDIYPPGPNVKKGDRQGRFALLGKMMTALFGGGFTKILAATGGAGGGGVGGGGGGGGGVGGGFVGGLTNILESFGSDVAGEVDESGEAGAVVEESSEVEGEENGMIEGLVDFCDTVENSIGVSVCQNGDGVCEYCDQCVANGGVTVGQCSTGTGVGAGASPLSSLYNKPSSPSSNKPSSPAMQLCCCQHSFDTDASTNATISYFTSPGFPSTVRHSFSTALSLEVRDDVDQILVEFVAFELPAGPEGCTDGDFIEVIAPTAAGGILGPGNSRFCGLNTDQHFYLDVNPGDVIIFKAVLSGVGFVPFKEEPSKKNKKNWHFRTGSSRFELKITQILKPISMDGMMNEFYKFAINNMTTEISEAFKNWDSKNYLKNSLDPYHLNGFCGEIPEYYYELRAPAHCLQFYSETRGTFQNFNFDGKTCMPPNLDYTICFDQPDKFCGLTLSALEFDIPTRDPKCMSGEKYSSDGMFPCCTAGFVGRYGAVNPKQVQKYLGVDGTSDGGIEGTTYSYNQPRYFFCGESLGRTDFVTSERRGPGKVKVYSDWHPCTECPGYKRDGVGFKIKYNIEIGTC